MKKHLSVVIITYNESEVLQECLLSIIWADEIIILDSGSIDNTRDIAKKYGARVFESTQWIGFGKQRQLAQEYARGDYILMLDADERVTENLRKSILEVLKNPKLNMVYSFSRRNFLLGRFMRHSGWYPDRVVRLYERNIYNYNEMPVHESLDIKNAQITILNGDLEHFACRDLLTFQRKQLKYAEFWAKEYHRQGRQCKFFSIINHTYSAFIKTWLLRLGFLDGKRGWFLAIMNAQYTFNKYLLLWILNKSTKN